MNILIIDDDTIVCSSLKIIIESAGHNVCAIGYSGKEAIELYAKHHPDIVIMDIRMKNLNGVEASREILKLNAQANILLLTTFEDQVYLREALDLGVKAYLLKQDFNKLEHAIEAVANGFSVYNQKVLSSMNTTSVKEEHPLAYLLTQKEVDVVKLVADGFNNKEIANKLCLSDGSVRNILSIILSKLELRDRTQLAIFYYQYMH